MDKILRNWKILIRDKFLTYSLERWTEDFLAFECIGKKRSCKSGSSDCRTGKFCSVLSTGICGLGVSGRKIESLMLGNGNAKRSLVSIFSHGRQNSVTAKTSWFSAMMVFSWVLRSFCKIFRPLIFLRSAIARFRRARAFLNQLVTLAAGNFMNLPSFFLRSGEGFLRINLGKKHGEKSIFFFKI